MVGPSLDDIAKKYAAESGAQQTLIKAVKDGHSGTWGMVPMPPHPNLPDSQIKQIIDWILSLK